MVRGVRGIREGALEGRWAPIITNNCRSSSASLLRKRGALRVAVGRLTTVRASLLGLRVRVNTFAATVGEGSCGLFTLEHPPDKNQSFPEFLTARQNSSSLPKAQFPSNIERLGSTNSGHVSMMACTGDDLELTSACDPLPTVFCIWIWISFFDRLHLRGCWVVLTTAASNSHSTFLHTCGTWEKHRGENQCVESGTVFWMCGNGDTPHFVSIPHTSSSQPARVITNLVAISSYLASTCSSPDT